MTRLTGMSVPLMTRKTWEKAEELFDKSEFQSMEYGWPFRRLIVIQKLQMEIQNLFMLQKDKLRDRL
jgi:hypothetical protein